MNRNFASLPTAMVNCAHERRTRENDIRRDAKTLLVGFPVVHAGERIEAADFMIGEMFVRVDVGLAATMSQAQSATTRGHQR
jgi:hypothetical protein